MSSTRDNSSYWLLSSAIILAAVCSVSTATPGPSGGSVSAHGEGPWSELTTSEAADVGSLLDLGAAQLEVPMPAVKSPSYDMAGRFVAADWNRTDGYSLLRPPCGDWSPLDNQEAYEAWEDYFRSRWEWSPLDNQEANEAWEDYACSRGEPEGLPAVPCDTKAGNCEDAMRICGVTTKAQREAFKRRNPGNCICGKRFCEPKTAVYCC